MERIRRALPLVLSVALILALGAVALRSTSTTERKAETIHRMDGILLQENLGRLTNQYLLIAAKEILDFTATRPLSLQPGAAEDRAELEAFIERSALIDYGATIVTLGGTPITSWGRGDLPAMDHPGFATFEQGLRNNQPGVSSVMKVDGVPLVAIGVPIMDDIGFPKALVVGFWRADRSKLQEYNEQLRYESGAKAHVVDANGTVVSSTVPEMVGASLADHPLLAEGALTSSGTAEITQDGEAITSIYGSVELGDWSLIRDVPTSEYYGPIRDSRRATDRALVALLGAAAAGLVLLNHRAAAARRRSEARFRSLVQNASDIITVVDGQGRIAYDSPAVEHTLRFDPDERVGQPFRDYVHPDRNTWLDAAGEELLRDAGNVVRGEMPVRRSDGSWCWFEVTAANMLDDPAVRGIVINQRDISDRIALHQQLTHQAYHDSLTGLPNRALFNSRLEEALGAETAIEGTVAVLFLDLDRFKVINDSLGHEGGDRLLVEVAVRLSRVLRRGDTLARLSGDEFAVLLTHSDEAEAMQVGERLINALRAPFVVSGKEIVVGTSVGVAMAEAAHRPEDLLRNADLAMYKAKERGRRCCELYQPDLGDWSRQRLEIENEMRRAVVDGELVLHYQPEVDVATGDVVGFEALVRWNHPERGLLPPGQFVPIAEETGLIVPVGEWVLREACRQLAQWRRLYRAEPAHERQRRQPTAPTARPDRRRPGGHRGDGHPGRRPGARTHRGRPHGRPGSHHHHPARTAGHGRRPGHRRLRDRVLLARLPQALPDHVTQARPFVRARPVRRHVRRCHRRGDRQPRPLPAGAGHRRGRRTGGSARTAAGDAVRPRPGIPLREAHAGRPGVGTARPGDRAPGPLVQH
ncbi:MAG TPA: diguanylate cyclase [Acidimicrobiia bacterium]|nr:diguanylate cyclase [Acidimicrobiia bacterium]